MTDDPAELERRARASLGRSEPAILDTVGAVLAAHRIGGTLADVGCGAGDLWRAVGGRFDRCIGIDAVRYEGLPSGVEFRAADLDRTPLPLLDAVVDAAAAVEVIEHLENPRAFVRELVRVVRPGGWVIVSTPNQLSALSLLTLVTKRRFPAFQDSMYPAHRTALLEVDLTRIAGEAGLQDIEVVYTRRGRMPLTSWHYAPLVAGLAPRLFSDNVVVAGRR
jgi:SAM-dependent methyltransferase